MLDLKRKLLLLGIAALMMLTVIPTAYGQASAESAGIDHPLLTVHYPVKFKTVKLRLGMSKKQVGMLIGKAKRYQVPNQVYYKYRGMTVAYEGDRLAMIVPDETGSLDGGVRPGMEWREAAGLLGIKADSGIRSLWFKADASGVKQLDDPAAIKAAEEDSDVYVLDVGVNALGVVSAVQLYSREYKNKLMEKTAEMNRLADLSSALPRLTVENLSLKTGDGVRRAALGMTKEEADRVLGKSRAFRHASGIVMHQYDGVRIYYRNGRAAAIQIDLDMESTRIYRTAGGEVSLLTSAAKLERLFGKPYYDDGQVLGYKFYRSGNRLVKLGADEPLEALKDKDVYDLSLIVTDDKNRLVTYMLLCDRQFAYTNS
ncbi:hypothetical protein KP806_25805 [Paenibacillus sp. N4]|uniref:hypothetical protein n=1 Tax=Paenibacillus vietnamensis TaxID=2590547 RepID=UPI001CD0AED5|nr:hypothetical protein [Paenibacillus vietnamensis]MCA0758476.1 hypothetical protein [Paenibacillus vietnamensis]